MWGRKPILPTLNETAHDRPLRLALGDEREAVREEPGNIR